MNLDLLKDTFDDLQIDEFRGQMFYVNTAVGLAPNHLTSVINNQEKRIQRLEKELNGMAEQTVRLEEQLKARTDTQNKTERTRR